MELNEDDQDKYLEEASQNVKQQAFYMKRAMDNNDLKQALKFSSEMLRELRTALLTPKNYYELYMQVGIIDIIVVISKKPHTILLQYLHRLGSHP